MRINFQSFSPVLSGHFTSRTPKVQPTRLGGANMFHPKSGHIFSALSLVLIACFGIHAQQVRSVVVQSSLVNYTGPCPVTITFLGKIRMSGPGEVRYVWRRSDGAIRPAQTLVFPAPGELEVTDTWELGGPGFPNQMRFEGLRVLAPQVRDSVGAWFRVQCQGARQGQGAGQGQEAGQGQGAGQGQEAGQGQGAAEDPQPGQEQHGPGLGLAVPDLTLTIAVPHPEQNNPRVFLVAHNRGAAIAPGTAGSHDPDHGFMIDVVLSSDREVPAEPAIYSPNYSEDVMIRGGRISRTVDLPRLAAKNYSLTIEIPADTPAGNYFLCARIDPFNKVMESIEANNTACTPFNVRPRQ